MYEVDTENGVYDVGVGGVRGTKVTTDEDLIHDDGLTSEFYFGGVKHAFAFA